MNSQKVDEGVLPFLDYLYIDLADLIMIRCVDCTDSLGIRHGGRRGTNCAVSGVHGEWHNGMVSAWTHINPKSNVLLKISSCLFIKLTLFSRD